MTDSAKLEAKVEKLPLVGNPYSRLAMPCPVGATAEVLVGPFNQVLPNVKTPDESPNDTTLFS